MWYALFHPMSGTGGTLYGGILGDAGLFVAAAAFLTAAIRSHTCHVDGCWRPGHTDPEIGHPACKIHHSCADKIGVCPDER